MIGFEPTSGNCQPITNKELTETDKPVLAASLDKIVQKHPEIELIIAVWPNLPEHTKAAIKALVWTSKTPEKS